MRIPIEYKDNGFDKTVSLQRKFDVVSTMVSLVIFMILFFSSVATYYDIVIRNVLELYSFFPILIFALILYSIAYSSRIDIARDASDGSVVVRRKTIGTTRDVFYKEEAPALKVTGLSGFDYAGKRFLLSVVSGEKETFLTPSLSSGRPGRKIFFQPGNQKSLWTFSNEDANAIASFLGLKLVDKVEEKKEAAGSGFAKNEITTREVVSTVVWGVVGFFIGFLNVIVSFVVCQEIGFSDFSSILAAMIVFFITMCLVIKFGNKISGIKRNPFDLTH
ncbi:MAG: hypothetical protein PHI66_04510 [Candidatus Pacebacteria bacterium]|nr:hypothetical protein [Candidatus Paceibacterota bacterium]